MNEEAPRTWTKHSADQRIESLTEREGEVLRLVARGMSNSEIAGALFVGETIVKTHAGHILEKLGSRDPRAGGEQEKPPQARRPTGAPTPGPCWRTVRRRGPGDSPGDGNQTDAGKIAGPNRRLATGPRAVADQFAERQPQPLGADPKDRGLARARRPRTLSRLRAAHLSALADVDVGVLCRVVGRAPGTAFLDGLTHGRGAVPVQERDGEDERREDAEHDHAAERGRLPARSWNHQGYRRRIRRRCRPCLRRRRRRGSATDPLYRARWRAVNPSFPKSTLGRCRATGPSACCPAKRSAQKGGTLAERRPRSERSEPGAWSVVSRPPAGSCCPRDRPLHRGGQIGGARSGGGATGAPGGRRRREPGAPARDARGGGARRGG